MAVTSIEQILSEAERLGYPMDSMRFFVGEDRSDPKCFGIFFDSASGEWVVYKNKADGSRYVRYRGDDEAAACSIFWAKVEETFQRGMAIRAAKGGGQPTCSTGSGKKRFRWRSYLPALIVLAAFLLFFIAGGISSCSSSHRRGYYTVGEDIYYRQRSDDWYRYDGGNWIPFYGYDEDWYDDGYYYGDSYDFDDPYDSFSYSDYYDDSYNSRGDNDSYDSDSDWDWDSDSDFDWGTDWDSDW